MSRKKENKPGHGWVSRAAVAEMFDVTTAHVDKNLRRFIPPDKVKSIGGRTYLHGRSLLEGWAAAQRADDVLLSGDDSPSMERWRSARADLAEMERDAQRRNLIPRDELDAEGMKLAGCIRRAGDALARRFGNDAASILNEALDEWERGVRGLIHNPKREVSHD
jgi:hypothetical protein